MKDKIKYDGQLMNEFRRVAENSTQVTAWYDHGFDGTVRGPFNRWFKCSEVNPLYMKHVANVADDCEFAAVAMNHFVQLLDLVEAQQKEIEELRIEKILLED